MPPRNPLTSSFAVSDQNNEVVCPLKNQDGTSCRKRCLGEKRYRSMQEHIRRAHPEHYIAKLPATVRKRHPTCTACDAEYWQEESFQLMINSPAQPRPPPTESPNAVGNNVYGHEREYRSPAPARTLEDVYPAAATAAVALAQLHNHKAEAEWNAERNHARQKHSSPSTTLELPSIQDHLAQENLNAFHSPRPRELLPSIMSRSPPGRSTTLPPIQRPRPRKPSITQNARKPRHERTRSKDHARRVSMEGRKAFSAEPQTAAAEVMNKRWEELVDAATSVADSDRDLTPIPPSPNSKRASPLPPFASSIPPHFEPYKASPLGRALTPPAPDEHPEPFPSVESSASDSGHAFHMTPTGLHSQHTSDGSLHGFSTHQSHLHSHNQGRNQRHDHTASTRPRADSGARLSSSFGGGGGNTSSPLQAMSSSNARDHGMRRPVEIFCASCRRPSVLRDSYACTECIGGFCADCVYALGSGGGGGAGRSGAAGSNAAAGGSGSGSGAEGLGSGPRACPRCGVHGGRYKPLQLDLRQW